MADTPKIVGVSVSVAIASGVAIVRQFAWRAVLWAFADTPTATTSAKLVEPPRLSLADQWAHLADVVMGAARQAEEATRCHASATQQLDLAQYALASLVDELASVMDMGDRIRRRATVHVLGVGSSPSMRPIGEAIAA